MKIKSVKQRISETDHRETKLQQIDEAKALAQSERGVLAEQLVTLEGQRAGMVSSSVNGAEYANLRYSLLGLSAVSVIADAPVQYLLNRIAFPSFPPLAVAICSPFVALALAVATHGVAHVATFDPVRPRRSVRICLTLAGILGVVAVAALTVLLYARTASVEAVPYLANLVSVALWTVGETLPVIAGLISAAGHTLSYPAIQMRRIRRFQGKLGNVDRFVEWLDSERSKVSQSSPASAHSTSGTIAKVAALILALGLAGMSQVASAQDLAEQSRTRPGTCAVFADWSESVNSEATRIAVLHLTDSLVEFVQAFRCETLRVGVFSDEGSFTPSTELNVPKPPTPLQCDLAQVDERGMRHFLRNLGSFDEYYRRESIQKCMEGETKEKTRYLQAMNEFRAKVRTSLLPAKPAKGRCTAIVGLLTRLLETGTETTVLITDAAETCAQGIPTIPSTKGGRAIFVLIPSRGDIRVAGPEAMERASMWKRVVANLSVILPSEVSSSAWAELASVKWSP